MELLLDIPYTKIEMVSVNAAIGTATNKYGKVFKYVSKDYREMQNILQYILKGGAIKNDVPLRVEYVFYTARVNSDTDNLIKCLQDILQKKYNFDDRNIYEVEAKKYPVGNKNEGFSLKVFQIKIPKIINELELTKDKNIRGDSYE